MNEQRGDVYEMFRNNAGTTGVQTDFKEIEIQFIAMCDALIYWHVSRWYKRN